MVPVGAGNPICRVDRSGRTVVLDSVDTQSGAITIDERLVKTAGGPGTDLTHDERWDLTLLRSAVRYQRWVLESFKPWLRGRTLEVGAGNGNFTRFLVDLADQVVVAEPDPEGCAEIEAMELDRVYVHCAPIEALSGETFESLVMLNVLEHIEDDAAALEAAKELLAPGGALCMLVPAHPALYGTLDRRYDHFRRYKRDEVDRALRDAGFDVKFCRYFNPLGAIGWWFVARAFRRPSLPRNAVRLSEMLGVPLGRRFHAPRFGQSVIAVAVRP
jgi:SAM-dependent methyltransferase